jgi:peptidoglycan/LPS O-acetylase OafA/YrhL
VRRVVQRDVAPGQVATGYRPWLDGVRAIAVLMVVAQHILGATRLDFGYTGVGLFFGLSGYLITSLLLDERDASGRVSLRGFYLRRGARLVPALVLVLVVCDILFLLQGNVNGPLGSLFALTYTANYAQVIDPAAMPAYGPTWSLAVEEHFYLLWPLVLLAVTRRWGLRTALAATLAACVASLVWRAGLTALSAPVGLLSMGTGERADALLYGCAAAIALRLGWRPRAWMLWLAVVAVGIAPAVLNRETYSVLVPGGALIGAASAAIVAGLDHVAPTWFRRSLSVRPLVIVGMLSYGLYLWHEPLMQAVQQATHAERGWRAMAALLAIAVAWLSHRYVEVPIRLWARRRASVLSTPTPQRGSAGELLLGAVDDARVANAGTRRGGRFEADPTAAAPERPAPSAL